MQMLSILIYLMCVVLLTMKILKTPLTFFDRSWRGQHKVKAIQLLNKQITRLFVAISKGDGQQLELVDYKFYTGLLEEIWGIGRRFGLDIRSTLEEIKSALSEEEFFEKKLRGLKIGAVFQFILIFFMGQILLYFCALTLEFTFPHIQNLLLIGWQALGVILLYFGLHFYYQKTFGPYEDFAYAMYTFILLLKVSLPIGKVVERSGINHINAKGSIAYLQERASLIVSGIMEVGSYPDAELMLLQKDFWKAQKEELERFNLLAGGLKFLVIALFFFPAYLMVIYIGISRLGF